MINKIYNLFLSYYLIKMGWKFCLFLSILIGLFFLPASFAMGQEAPVIQPLSIASLGQEASSIDQLPAPPIGLEFEEKILLEQDNAIQENAPECNTALCRVGMAMKHAFTKALTIAGLLEPQRGQGDGICQDKDNGDVRICSLSEKCYGFYLEDEQDIYHKKTFVNRFDFPLLEQCGYVDKFGNGFDDVPCEQRIEFFENGNKFLIGENSSRLELSNNTPAYRYIINFSNESSPITGDFKHPILKIFGEEWRMMHSEGNNLKKIILMNNEKSQKVSFGKESIINYNGKEYSIFVNFDDKKKSSEVSIGGNNFSVNVGDIIELSDNITAGVEEIANDSMLFSFGARKIVLENGKGVEEWSKLIGRERLIAGSIVEIEAYDEKKENRLKSISITYIPTSILQIREKEYWTDPIFGRFKFTLEETILAENCSTYPQDCGECEELNETDNLTNETDDFSDLINDTADFNETIDSNFTDEDGSLPATPQPDVASYLESNQRLTVGVDSNITANIENIGEGNASNVSVVFYEISGSKEAELARGDIGPLSTNQKADVSILFIANESKEYHFRISADVANDCNLSNNLYNALIMAVSESSNETTFNETNNENSTNLTDNSSLYNNEDQQPAGSGGSGGGGGSSASKTPAMNNSSGSIGGTASSNSQSLPAPVLECEGTEIFGYCNEKISFQWIRNIQFSAFVNWWWILIIIFILVLISLITSYLEMVRCNKIAKCKKKEFISTVKKQGNI